ncbi:uncharacterized protein LOC134230240 [Saccostrea cucullata]|uniref:uncharacterized protein LOC134230240 n=1 Tax=Saccostrea cuccullata TaxID=36930 RepID=UPI002ED12E95
MILLISFAMRHSLTGEAIADLLVLLELHCLTPNLCRTNLTSFMDFFRNFKSPLEFHHYCEHCFLYMGMEKAEVCPNCNKPPKKNSAAYFLVIPIAAQLSKMFADGSLVQQIWEHKASRQDDGMLKDICDGKLYKETFTKDGYFTNSTAEHHGQLHISFQMNTDGVSLFRSSSFSIWPVYLVINELPPHLRFSRRNRVFAGLWFGYSKPNFCTFLRPFAESLHQIYRTGLKVDNLTIRGILLNGVFDAPARCLFQNMVQFNGFNGCPYCLVPGKTVQTSERGHTLAYPFNLDSTTGFHEPRTHESFTRCGEEAETNKTNGGKQSAVSGVKGLTWFSYFPHFNIVRGVAIDYMHCVLLGVVKMLLTLWFDKSHRNEPYSIASRIGEVDRRLLAIKPPNFISRFPRSLVDVSHFKAAELKNFLLYYSLPCLFGILSEDQFHHFSLLVFTTYKLLQDKISSRDILHCRQMMLEFVLNIPVLYHERYSTSNIHLLLHIVDKVEDLGPLWSSSCFYFEDFNGQLRRLFHGTQHIQCQIAFAVGVHQSLPQLSQMLNHGTSERDLFLRLTEKKSQPTSENICDSVYVIGAFYNRPFTQEEERALTLAVGNFDSVLFFKRLSKDHQILHSAEYKATTRRNNTVVGYGGNSYGIIQTLVKVKRNIGEDAAYALMSPMDKVNIVIDGRQRSSPNHMISLKPSLNAGLVAVSVVDITDVCVYVPVNDELSFVSSVPNRVEKE